MDDATYTTAGAPVPEPASIVLLIVGSIAFVSVRKLLHKNTP
jgi:hypothetical protein